MTLQELKDKYRTRESNWARVSNDDAYVHGTLAQIRDIIADLETVTDAAEPTKGHIVVLEYAWYVDPEDKTERPTLAYLWPSEFNRKVYPSFDAASAFIKSQDLPLGWVSMEIKL